MNITTPLLSLADVAIAGHISGGNMIGAVAVGGTVFNVMYWLFAFLRMGTSGLTAQAYGADDALRQRRVFVCGMRVAAVGSLVVLTLSALVGLPLLTLVDGGGGVTDVAWRYFRVAIVGAPGVLTTMVVSGWLLGMQRSQPILWIALFTNVLNIALSCIFVFVAGWSIEGLALGTAAAQLAGAAVGLYVVRVTMQRNVANGIIGNTDDKPVFRPFFRVSGDIFLRTLCLAAVTLWFTHAGSVTGTEYLAANALLLQLFLIFSYFMDGFAFGGEALAGRYFGAGDKPMLRRTVRSLFVWGTATAVIFTVVYFVFGNTFLTLLTDDVGVQTTASRYMAWAVAVPFAGFTAFTWDGIFIGLTRTRWMLVSMASAMVVFFGLYFGLGAIYSNPETVNHHLWLAFVSYLAVRGITSSLLYRKIAK